MDLTARLHKHGAKVDAFGAGRKTQVCVDVEFAYELGRVEYPIRSKQEVYSVIFELLVERSRSPECDAARALLAQGIG